MEKTVEMDSGGTIYLLLTQFRKDRPGEFLYSFRVRKVGYNETEVRLLVIYFKVVKISSSPFPKYDSVSKPMRQARHLVSMD